MMRNFIMKTYYKKMIDGIVNNFIVCSTSNKAYHQNKPTDKIIRLDETELQPRILKYFRDSTNHEMKFDKDNNVVNSENWSKLNELSNSEISALILSLMEPSCKIKSTFFKTYVKNLDKECCVRLPTLTNSEIFIFLHDFINVVPHLITQLQFYTKAMLKFSFLIEHCSKIEILQLCFYIALQKKTDESKKIVKECLTKINFKYLNNFSTDDLLVLCNSSYKTSTKISHRKILDKVINTIYENLSILNDTALFITLIKTIRQNKCQNEEFLTTISNTIFFNKTIKYYNFTANTHILALYADALYYDNHLFKLILDVSTVFLRDTDVIIGNNEYFARQVRVKDISRFIWALSYVNCEDLDHSIITTHIIPILQQYITLGDLEKNTEHYIDILLSLWIMGYMPDSKFFHNVISRNTISLIYGQQKRRFSSRLNLLLVCVQMEKKELLPPSLVISNKPVAWNKNVQMRNRPYLKTIYTSLCNISSKINIDRFEFTSPIPHLNIIGITGFDKDNNPSLNIELIDEQMKVKNTEDTPHGLMKLKIRLMNKFRKNVLIVFKDDVETLNQSELNTYMERKIRIIRTIK